VAEEALQHIDEIKAYIAQHDLSASRRVGDRIYEIIGFLTEFPLAGRKTLERDVRALAIKPYPFIVFYRYSKRRDELRIVRVRHGAMRRAGLADEAQEFRAQPAS
jgi:plasmid stabilization system protein ParE